MAITIVPPVRTRVPLRAADARTAPGGLQALFPGARILLLDSGTQALAAALRDAADRSHGARPHREKSQEA